MSYDRWLQAAVRPDAGSAKGAKCTKGSALGPWADGLVAMGQDLPTAGLLELASAVLAGQMPVPSRGQPPTALLDTGSRAPASTGNGAPLPAGSPVPRPSELPVQWPELDGGGGIDQLRRQAHDLVETLLGAAIPRTPLGDRVPLLRGEAPVDAGAQATVAIRVANEDAEPAVVSLYCSNFVADSGCEIPSLRVSFLPRVATIPSKGDAQFDVKIAVPAQALPGAYSGLIQANGTKYVKAVVTFDVK